MSWQNTAALWGFVLLAAPIVAHLFSRHRARVVRVPSLRFVDRTRLMPMRLTRLSDWPLLLVRMAIVAAAVMALARPRWTSGDTPPRAATVNDGAGRAPSGNAAVDARVVLVDTSASAATRADTAADDSNGGFAAALARADSLASSARNATIAQTADVAAAIDGALQWFDAVDARGTREIAIVSDFQIGSIDSAALAQVPAAVGIRLVRSRSHRGMPRQFELLHRGVGTRVVFDVDAGSTAISYAPRAATTDNASAALLVQLLAGDASMSTRLAQQTIAGLSLRDARSHAPGDAAPSVVVMFPGHEGYAAAMRRASPARSAWMARVIARVQDDALVQAAGEFADVSSFDGAMLATDSTSAAEDSPLHVVRNTGTRRRMARVGADTARGESSLLFLAADGATSPDAVLLVGAVERAVRAERSIAISELDSTSLGDTTLARWERAASGSANGARDDVPLARWLWAVALLLLVVETVIRRAASESVA